MPLKTISNDTIRLIQQWVDLSETIQSDLEAQGRTDLRNAFPVSDCLEYLDLSRCIECGDVYEPVLRPSTLKWCPICHERLTPRSYYDCERE